MDALTIVYLAYAFIALFFLFLFTIVYLQNKKDMLYCPKTKKIYSLDMVVPCYNEEDTIEATVKALMASDYSGLNRIYVVDDCSTDGSYKIIKRLAARYSNVVALQTPQNTGRAANAKNFGAKFAKSEMIGFTDADSFPDTDAISKAMGFFNNEKVAGVTALIIAKNRKKTIERLQSLEYKVIAFTRKLLGFLEAIYVTPGPLAIYRKKIFIEIGGFDEKNVTEDIEITWNLVSRGYKVEMSMTSKVLTVIPDTLRQWYRQRIRWNIGGIQTIKKYRHLFMKKGSLGSFILPFFISSWIIGGIGLAIQLYNFGRRIFVNYLSTVYSVEAQTAILTLREINLTPSILSFYGIFLFILGLSFTIFVISFLKEKDHRNEGILTLAGYTIFYLSVYPIILIVSVYNYLKGGYSW
jgi:cellulose synthase/poly-beta-1,6-N-acetylglucosamine synthase-like glycosyltransferase